MDAGVGSTEAGASVEAVAGEKRGSALGSLLSLQEAAAASVVQAAAQAAAAAAAATDVCLPARGRRRPRAPMWVKATVFQLFLSASKWTTARRRTMSTLVTTTPKWDCWLSDHHLALAPTTSHDGGGSLACTV
mmetsp:Transcript_96742/g.202177  ORF Transcript_96742/g.202177 Transcript_96742/m.202177 type:complete len:133 (+) Transcript_96742:761-1159(+)